MYNIPVSQADSRGEGQDGPVSHAKKIYDRQRRFFSDAYRTGRVGWPRQGHSKLVEFLLEAWGPGPAGVVLEIGTGEGRNLSPLIARGMRVVAIDIVPEPLLTARERTGSRNEKGENVSFLQADLFTLPFGDGVFDMVFDFGVFHHLRRRERKLYPGWVGRILKSEGLLGLGVFSEYFRHDSSDVRSRSFVTHRGHHDVFFREGDLPALMGRAFLLESSGEEGTGDGLSHYRLAVYRKSGERKDN